MMAKKGLLLGALTAACMLPATALAQPVDLPIPAATTDSYPAGISVRETPAGPVYVDARGLTLYGLDMRTVRRWAPDPTRYCKDACAQVWEPVLAPADAKVNIMFPQGFGDRSRAAAKPAGAAAPASPAAQPRLQGERAPGQAALQEGFVLPQRAPDWTVIEGPGGPQWVYKGWHMVYTRKNDRPGSTAHDGEDQFTWNTLKFVPPVPSIVAPTTVGTVFAAGRYAFAAKDGRVLFTGACGDACSAWEPLAGGYASRGVGEWAISRAGDRPQWTWRGKPVYVSRADDPLAVPENAEVLRP